MSILHEIVTYKRQIEIPRRMAKLLLAEMRKKAEAQPAGHDFVSALRAESKVALIAEVKKASPSRGLLRADFDAPGLAQNYADNGATAISVLTDEKYFQGSLNNLKDIRQKLKDMPLLCKDFIVEPYQLYEARLNGADCALLIAAILDDAELADLYCLACALGMQTLIEIHHSGELERVLKLSPHLLGVNNRNLHDFSTDINTCLALRKLVPHNICFVAESGIHDHHDMNRLYEAGVDAALVGEALVTAQDVGAKLRELRYGD